jgi:hypothetical protein
MLDLRWSDSSRFAETTIGPDEFELELEELPCERLERGVDFGSGELFGPADESAEALAVC